uniref:Uncharacterized protein n=1 Tax=Eutreptiella gymnastica TaxID=73025 RepID=A0A7S4LI88_9EUGL
MHHATNVVKKLHELDGASPSRHSSPGNIHYAVIPDYLNSVASVSEVPRGADPWKVYTVDLIDVGTVMKERKQGWNQQYAAAARIFNDDLSGQALRATIHMQYKQMFVTSPGTKRGVLASGREFLQLMHCGVVRGKPRMFTYVIMEDRMTFTETGRAMKDVLSKHALLSNAAREVRYSGEFHVQPLGGTGGEHRLVIDNNSGTYAPEKADLPLLKELLLHNFPGLNVEVYDREDPALKAYTKEVKALQ